MNLYLISQTVNTDYDTYDSAVVAAEDESSARLIHPAVYKNVEEDGKKWYELPDEFWNYSSWCRPEHVTVYLIGSARKNLESGVVCASFNAG